MLDVRRLRLLRELAERRTVTAVAHALSYTPSAVSQQLAALERDAGVPLLERVGRGVQLTEAGPPAGRRTPTWCSRGSRRPRPTSRSSPARVGGPRADRHLPDRRARAGAARHAAAGGSATPTCAARSSRPRPRTRCRRCGSATSTSCRRGVRPRAAPARPGARVPRPVPRRAGVRGPRRASRRRAGRRSRSPTWRGDEWAGGELGHRLARHARARLPLDRRLRARRAPLRRRRAADPRAGGGDRRGRAGAADGLVGRDRGRRRAPPSTGRTSTGGSSPPCARGTGDRPAPARRARGAGGAGTSTRVGDRIVIIDIAPGLWIWRVDHPEWDGQDDWDPAVTCTCVESGGEVVAIDPLGVRRGVRAPRRQAADAWWRSSSPTTCATSTRSWPATAPRRTARCCSGATASRRPISCRWTPARSSRAGCSRSTTAAGASRRRCGSPSRGPSCSPTRSRRRTASCSSGPRRGTRSARCRPCGRCSTCRSSG